MATWSQFRAEASDISDLGEEQLFQYDVGLAFLATVREDGAPRMHPVCPVLSESHLYVFILPDSPKRMDLEKDGRYALQAFPQPKPDSDEFYLSGSARRIRDPDLFSTVLADAKHPASPDEILFELEIDRALHTRWQGFGTPDYHSIHSKWTAD